MSNSNGMYNVLNIFKKLEPTQEQQVKAEAQRIYESVEAKGSILEGVKSTEQRLREQFDAMKEGEKVPTKGGHIHKGTYGNEYDPGDDGTKKPKKVVNKGVKGRPKKEKPASFDAPKGDIFGRTTGKIPKGKGTVVKGKAMSHDDNNRKDDIDEVAPPGAKAERMVKGIKKSLSKDGNLSKKDKAIAYATTWKAHKQGKVEESRQLSEGVNFSEMVKKHTMTLDEMMQELSNDIMEFKRSGHVSDTLKDCMSVYEYGKKQLTDSAHTQHALDLNPDLKRQAQPPKPSVLGKVGDIAKKGLDVLTGPDDEGLMRDLARKTYNEEEELNELARLAGLSVTEAKAKKDYDGDGKIESGKDEYLGSKIAAAKEAGKLGEGEMCSKCKCDPCKCDDVEEGNEFSGELAKAKAQHKKEFEVDGKTYPVKEGTQVDECMSPMGSMAQGMEEQQGKINVSTNMSSDGHKNVSINADGDAADQLMQMLKMAGIGADQAEKHVQLVIAKPAGHPEAQVAEAEAQYANTPDEEYEGVDAITDQGADMNRQKKQFADKPKAGDNPMATQQMAEEVDPIADLGRNLMKEYQSLKLAK